MVTLEKRLHMLSTKSHKKIPWALTESFGYVDFMFLYVKTFPPDCQPRQGSPQDVLWGRLQLHVVHVPVTFSAMETLPSQFPLIGPGGLPAPACWEACGCIQRKRPGWSGIQRNRGERFKKGCWTLPSLIMVNCNCQCALGSRVLLARRTFLVLSFKYQNVLV